MKRKIYFAGSIRGGRNDKEVYLRLIRHLSKYGDVLTEHVGNTDIADEGEEGLSDEYIFQRDISWLRESDVVVAEVSTPSIGVGYEIGIAEGMNKPILCLFRNRGTKKLSAMIAGNSKLHVLRYESFADAIGYLDNFFDKTDNKL
jgi:2'-deoxynucleoside 5'-phosphate N-hydrolase